jgi:hypothetical protein
MHVCRSHRRPSAALGFAFAASLTAGCADDLAPTDNGEPVAPSEQTPQQDEFGVSTMVVVATDPTRWVYLNLEDGSFGPELEGWMLGFQRFHIKANGGVSGNGQVALHAAPGADFEAIGEAPLTGWKVDAPDGDDDDDRLDLAIEQLGGWYDYDVSTHVLTPKPVVWFVRRGDSLAFKLQVQGYYDEAGTPAHLAIRWARITLPAGAEPVPGGDPGNGGSGVVDPGEPTAEGGAPEPQEPQEPVWPQGSVEVDASLADQWVYLSLAAGVLGAAAPADPLGWDLAMSRTRWRTNSGVSGDGFGGAQLTLEPYDDLAHAPTFGYTEDTLMAPPGPPGSPLEPGNPALASWFDYNPATHGVSPKDQSFLVRTAAGEYAKLRIEGWLAGKYILRWESVPGLASAETTTIDASSKETWTYWSFSFGQVLESVEDGSLDWDLAFRRTEVRTNGGTSGAGQGAAADLGDVEILDVTSPDSFELASDEMLPLPGPPGSGESSGNPVLSSWYDYNPQTHKVSPRAKAFLVRTAHGDWAQLRVFDWQDGVFTVQWAFAGVGQSAFSVEPSP